MSFRKYGGLQFAAKHNMVTSNYNTANNLLVTQAIGQQNSYINLKSDLSANLRIYGSLDVIGNTILDGSLEVMGNTILDGSLNVTGNTILDGSLDVIDNTILYGSLDVIGNTTLDGSLNVTGNTTLDSSLNVYGNTTLDGSLDVSGATFLHSSLDVSGNTILDGSLNVTGATHLYSSLDVSGAITFDGSLNVFGATHLNSSLDVSGNTTLDGSLDVYGTTTLSGEVRIKGQLVYDSSSGISVPYLDVSGNTTLWGNVGIGKTYSSSYALDVSGATHLNSSLDVSGATHLYSSLDVSGNTTLNGNVTIKGQLYYDMSSMSVPSLDVSGNTTLWGNVGIGKTYSSSYALDVSGNVNVTGSATLTTLSATGLTVTGGNTSLSTLSATGLTVTGGNTSLSTLSATGLTVTGGISQLQSGLSVTGSATLNNGLNVTGSATLNSGLTVTGSATLNNGLNVTGTANITSDITCGYNQFSSLTNYAIFSVNTTNSNNYNIGLAGWLYIGSTGGGGSSYLPNPSSFNWGAIGSNFASGHEVNFWNTDASTSDGVSGNLGWSFLATNGYNNGTTNHSLVIPCMTLDRAGNAVLNGSLSFTTTDTIIGPGNISLPVSNGMTTGNMFYGDKTSSYMRQFCVPSVCYIDYYGIFTFRSVASNGLEISSSYLTIDSTNNLKSGYLQIAPDYSNVKYSTSVTNIITTNYSNGSNELSFIHIIDPSYNALVSCQWYTLNSSNVQTTILTLYNDGSLTSPSGTMTAVSFNATSDYRIKENIIPLNETHIIDKLNPVTYMNLKSGKQDIGLIAHELQEVYPELVTGTKDGEDMQSVNYTGLIPILIKEIQNLKERVKQLELQSYV
jgi:cytoskeletal protein CcmA (bactofilin family)